MMRYPLNPISSKFQLGLFYFLVNTSLSISQPHLAPPDGGDGVAGTIPKSFVIEWAPVEGAIAYEYVMSDNPYCFTGCSGDTRQRVVSAPSATEYNLQTDVWYYWITRIILSPEDTSEWTLISSFFATTPESPGYFVNIYPNPATDDVIRLTLDWGIDPNAKEIAVSLYNSSGQPLRNWVFKKPGNSTRFEEVEIPGEDLISGLYFIQVAVNGGSSFNPNNLTTQKLMLR